MTETKSGVSTEVESDSAMLPIASRRQVRRRVRVLLRGRGLLIAVTVGMLIAESVLGLAGPVAIGWIAQAVADDRHAEALVRPIIFLVVSLSAGAAAAWAGAVLLARVVLPAVAQLREEALAAAVDLPIDVIEAGGVGDVVSRVSGDAQVLAEVSTGALGRFVVAGLTIVTTVSGLATLDWRFAVAGMMCVPIQALALRWFLRQSAPIYAGGRVAEGHRTSVLLASLTALPTVRALRLSGRQRDRIEQASVSAMSFEFRAARTATTFFGLLNIAEFVGLTLILIAAFIVVRAGVSTVGAATTAALFFVGLFGPVNTALGVFDSIQRAGAALGRLTGMAAAPCERTMLGPAPGVVARPLSGPQLTATDIRSGYLHGPDVLKEITFRLERMQRVAVVGMTGSGKSTLASVLAGLHAPRSGTVTLDGIPISEISVPQRKIALVTQEPHVFAGTIADNIRLARREATGEIVDGVLCAVGADGWISALPQGSGTYVGEGGQPLTASQAQQIALARVLLLDPPIVILDEATAEAGSDSSRRLDHAAAAVCRGRSSVIIAHRLSQAVDADLIVVMDAGRIVEQGTHDELRKSDGAYALMWKTWSQGPANI